MLLFFCTMSLCGNSTSQNCRASLRAAENAEIHNICVCSISSQSASTTRTGANVERCCHNRTPATHEPPDAMTSPDTAGYALTLVVTCHCVSTRLVHTMLTPLGKASVLNILRGFRRASLCASFATSPPVRSPGTRRSRFRCCASRGPRPRGSCFIHPRAEARPMI